jgi:hypothetical protein
MLLRGGGQVAFCEAVLLVQGSAQGEAFVEVLPKWLVMARQAMNCQRPVEEQTLATLLSKRLTGARVMVS